MGDVTGAQQALTRAFDLSPNDPNAWLVKAYLLHRTGEAQSAHAAFLRSLSLARDTTARTRATPGSDPSYFVTSLREFQPLGNLDASDCAAIAKRRADRRGMRNRIETDWLTRRAVELATDREKAAFWAYRAETLEMSRQRRLAISRPPASLQVEPGGTATFRVDVSSDEPVQFQWRRDEAVIPGATNATLSLNGITRAEAGLYSVLVHSVSPAGRIAEVSSPAALTIRDGNLIYGGLRRERYRSLPAGALTHLTSHPRFPDQPDETGVVGSFESPNELGAIYGLRLSGFLIPPVSGDYLFSLCSDNEGALFLSSDSSPEHKRRIAWEPFQGSPRFWRGGGSKCSAPIWLESGRRYYVEALLNSDRMAVAWQMPGQPALKNGDPPIPGASLAFISEATRTTASGQTALDKR
jgi:hypothetical protein